MFCQEKCVSIANGMVGRDLEDHPFPTHPGCALMGAQSTPSSLLQNLG